jgi:hypothetical protein
MKDVDQIIAMIKEQIMLFSDLVESEEKKENSAFKIEDLRFTASIYKHLLNWIEYEEVE